MSDVTTPASESPEPAPALRIRQRRPILASLDRPLALGFAVTLGALAAFTLGVALTSLSTILIYIALAIFIALGLDPVVKRLERHGMSRPRAIIVVFAAFTVIVLVAVVFVLPPAFRQIAEFVQSIPAAIMQFQASDWYRGFEAQIGDVVGNGLDQLAAFLSDPGNLLAIGGGVLAVGFGIGNAISGTLIVIVLTLYFLASLTAFQAAFYRLAPARERKTVAELTETITDSVGAYLIGMVALAGCNAAFATILHLVLGLPFPAFMGLASFLITLIPLVGPVLYWIFASVIALFTDPVLALIFAVLYLIYMQFEAYLLTPRVMNKAIAVPGALVIIGALVGGTLLGLLGALVAIPVTAAILLIIKQLVIPRQDAKT
ncbi:AI-2E family transporter [Microbacterium saperdae]|uniref:Putative PurR-regulated permease PerM n=1 Tax=Microbacterium saperdae TaxID=69368 RepID=A0A543BCC8_9MICO|nr:AI-2E family transporter [Microbacterium saperdae]TQL82491.1 putative PurR-regulated permease PerM [Microbacterium saperdae]GGM40310.1 AI-2E family transporter [Microbacterium saperdae]